MCVVDIITLTRGGFLLWGGVCNKLTDFDMSFRFDMTLHENNYAAASPILNIT